MRKIRLDLITETELEAASKDLITSYRKLIDAEKRRPSASLKPFSSELLESGSLGHGINTEYCRKMVYDHRPYSFFATLTFPRNMSLYKIRQYCTTLIHRFNSLEFGRKYTDFITGFAFLEKHSNNPLSNENHLHLLIKHHEVFDKSDFSEHLAKFHKASSRIVDGLNRPVFNKKCIDFQAVYDNEGVIEYCFKDLWDKNLSRLKFIDRGGLSDNQE